jgi:hypothetical protein
VDELIASIDRITEVDVRRLARAVVARESLCLVALGPSDGAPYAPADLADGTGAPKAVPR